MAGASIISLKIPLIALHLSCSSRDRGSPEQVLCRGRGCDQCLGTMAGSQLSQREQGLSLPWHQGRGQDSVIELRYFCSMQGKQEAAGKAEHKYLCSSAWSCCWLRCSFQLRFLSWGICAPPFPSPKTGLELFSCYNSWFLFLNDMNTYRGLWHPTPYSLQRGKKAKKAKTLSEWIFMWFKIL